MIVTKTWIEKNYDKFNKMIWNGELPNLTFKTNRTNRTWGFATYRYDLRHNTIHPESITLSNYYDSPESVKVNILLHEMVHIADYHYHPEHYVWNHRKVSGHSYDAHGYWFHKEADRVNKIVKSLGYLVSDHVTSSEVNSSSLSSKVKSIQNRKKNDAIICVVEDDYDSNKMWIIKTDINCVERTKDNIWKEFGKSSEITCYSFDCPQLASQRNSISSIRGYKNTKDAIKKYLEKIHATEVYV